MSDKKILDEKESVLIKFLQRTKEGEYAPVDPESLRYARISVFAEMDEEEYYYGLS